MVLNCLFCLYHCICLALYVLDGIIKPKYTLLLVVSLVACSYRLFVVVLEVP